MTERKIFSDVPDARRMLMRRVKGTNTKPELAVRRALHAMGYRFRLHRRDLPGRPDIVLPRHRIAIFVHGCFWHRHAGCRGATTPKTRTDFWAAKFDANIARDRAAEEALKAAGWRVLIIWECETKDTTALRTALAERLAHLRDT
jgi:DNA mismatch endonuclease (patch repair protein)